MNGKGSPMEMAMSFLPIILIFGVFYIFIIRPQQKKAKKHAEMIAGLKIGTGVITNAGIIGVISKIIDDKFCEIQIASGVVIRILRSVIGDVLSDTDAHLAKYPSEQKNNFDKNVSKERFSKKSGDGATFQQHKVNHHDVSNDGNQRKSKKDGKNFEKKV